MNLRRFEKFLDKKTAEAAAQTRTLFRQQRTPALLEVLARTDFASNKTQVHHTGQNVEKPSAGPGASG